VSLKSNYSSPAPGGLWVTLNRLLFVLIAVTVLTAVGYRYLPEISKRNAQELQLEALKSEIEHQKQLLARRTREEALLKHDPEYIGMIARDQLDLMRGNETIYRVELSRPEMARMKRNP
jgi:cell division protein FtsB